MKNQLKIKQHNISDCGAACLCSIGYFYGVKLPMAQIREYCGATHNGITLKGIIEGAAKMGLQADGYKATNKDINSLKNINSPFIAHTESESGTLHYIVVYKIDKSSVTIMDPALGDFIKLTYNEFIKIWSGYILVVIVGNNFSKRDTTVSLLRRLFDILNFHRKELILIFIGSLALIFIGILNSVIIKVIIDRGLSSSNKPMLLIIASVLIFYMITSLQIAYSKAIIVIKNNLKVDCRLITCYLAKIINLPISFFNSYQIGDINSRLSDAFKVRALISDGLISGIISILTLIGALIAMFIYNPRMTLYTLLFMPLYFILFYISLYVNKRYNREIVKEGAEFESKIIDTLSGIKNIKYFGAQQYGYKRIESSFGALIYKMERGAIALTKLSTLSSSLTQALLIFIIIYGGYCIMSSTMSLGEVVSFYTLSAFLTSPINSLVNMNSIITEGIISCERLFEIIDLESENEENKEQMRATKYNINRRLESGKDINIKELTFGYIGRDELFTNTNLHIPSSSITAIIGESGCGKSSLGALLMQDYIVNSGAILYGDINIYDLPINIWRDFISIIPQKCYLFNTTIIENIIMGGNNYNLDEIYEICYRVGLKETLKRLPSGIFTNVGSGGNNLSGGECQKIAIARAIYRGAGILIFDEATSSLDSISEELVINLMQELKREGKIIIMITHKLSNLKYADNIIKLSARS